MPAKEATAKVVEKKQIIFAKQTVLIKVGVKNVREKLAVVSLRSLREWKKPFTPLYQSLSTGLSCREEHVSVLNPTDSLSHLPVNN